MKRHHPIRTLCWGLLLLELIVLFYIWLKVFVLERT